MEEVSKGHTAYLTFDSSYATLDLNIEVDVDPNLKILKCVPLRGRLFNKADRLRVAVVILLPLILPLQSTRKMNS